MRGRAVPQPSVNRPSDSPVIVSLPLQISTSKESRSQSIPTRRRNSRFKYASRHSVPLCSDMPVYQNTDCDAVTDIASVKTFNAPQRRQRGALSSTLGSSPNGHSHFPKTRRYHASHTLGSPKLDAIESRQDSDGASTTSNSKVPSRALGNASAESNRGFRARLMLSEARKTIQNCKTDQSDSGPKRNRSRTPFVMDIVLELKAQYAGYTTEDLYVTLEAMRRREDVRPVFEHLVHDFSTGAESVSAYWDNQAKVWQDWKIPVDEDIDSGSVRGLAFPPGPGSEGILGAAEMCQRLLGTEGILPPDSLSNGRASFPDSIERSTASWCPVLRCDSATDFHRHIPYAPEM